MFGQWGTALYRKARGIDSYEFFVDAEAKSLSHNQTFGEDTNDAEKLHATLSHLCQKASKRLRDAGLHARTVTLTIRFADFRTITRSQTLAEASDLDAVFLKTILDLFARSWNGKAMLRLVGVALTGIFRRLGAARSPRSRPPGKARAPGAHHRSPARQVRFLETPTRRLARKSRGARLNGYLRRHRAV